MSLPLLLCLVQGFELFPDGLQHGRNLSLTWSQNRELKELENIGVYTLNYTLN